MTDKIIMMNKIKNILVNGADGKPVTLDIFFIDDGRKKPALIYAHGFNGFKDWGNFDLLATRFAIAGLVLVKFNFSHNGTTPANPEAFDDLEAFGQNNYSRQLEDLAVVTNWVDDALNPYAAAIDRQQIFLAGHSMGGGIAILFAAADKRIQKLVGWAAISECKTPWGSWPESRLEEWRRDGVQYYTNSRTNQQMPLYYQLYEDYQNNRERLNIQKAAAALTIPFLVCHGSNDIAVPVEKAFQLASWQPAAELFIVDSNHVFDRKHPWVVTWLPEAMEQVLEKTIAFLK